MLSVVMISLLTRRRVARKAGKLVKSAKNKGASIGRCVLSITSSMEVGYACLTCGNTRKINAIY